MRIATALLRYGWAILLSGLVLAWVLRLWHADLTIPFEYHGDALLNLAWVKGLIENGWYLHNDAVGAPAGLDMRDFPLADNLHFLILKLIAAFTSNPALVINLFFLLTFPLSAVTALFVFRRLEVGYVPAFVGSLLFAFLPYHFLRGQGHLFLAAYYLVPLAVLVMLWLYLDRGLFFAWDEAAQAPRWQPTNRRTLGAVLVCLLTGGAGVYYAFFG